MRGFAGIATFLALALVAPGAVVFAQSHSAGEYVVIVNPTNPITTVERRFLEDAFLKRVTRWPSDQPIRPVDQGPGSPVRRAFTEEVLRRSVEAVKGYWQQHIFSGRDVPPPELDSDAEVIKYVLRYDGAIGYVPSGANLNGCKVLIVE
jgi:ABC-type phosphate transport system substrate-binding protein